MGLKKVNGYDVEPVDSFLAICPTGSLQRTVREGAEIHRFSLIHRPHEHLLEGLIWTPSLNSIRYDLDFSGVLPRVVILKGSGNIEADVKMVEEEIPQLCLTAGVRKAAFLSKKRGGGGKGKKGYYIEAGVAKEDSLKRFRDAVQLGIGDYDLVEYCIPRAFKMKFYKS